MDLLEEQLEPFGEECNRAAAASEDEATDDQPEQQTAQLVPEPAEPDVLVVRVGDDLPQYEFGEVAPDEAVDSHVAPEVVPVGVAPRQGLRPGPVDVTGLVARHTGRAG